MSDVDSNVPDGYRQIPGFPRYAVSESGIVLSICGNGKGACRQWSDARQLSQHKCRGYPCVMISVPGSRARTTTVHSLVLTAFVGPRPDGMECRHLDGDKTNNHVSNLAWGTSVENNRDRDRHGTTQRGEKHYVAKVTAAKVKDIRKRRARGELCSVLANEFHVTPQTIWLISQRLTWAHLP